VRPECVAAACLTASPFAARAQPCMMPPAPLEVIIAHYLLGDCLQHWPAHSTYLCATNRYQHHNGPSSLLSNSTPSSCSSVSHNAILHTQHLAKMVRYHCSTPRCALNAATGTAGVNVIQCPRTAGGLLQWGWWDACGVRLLCCLVPAQHTRATTT
jgi:hypothetical protein